MKKLLKSKKGTTLVELTIVIALVAIITSMVSVFLAGYQTSAYKVENSTALMEDINAIESFMNDWITKCDSCAYEFGVTGAAGEAASTQNDFQTGDVVTARVVDGYSKQEDITGNKTGWEFLQKGNVSVQFIDHRLQMMNTDDKPEKEIELENIRAITFTLASGYYTFTKGNATVETEKTVEPGENVLICEITTEKGENQRIIFTLFSATQRERYSVYKTDNK